jgi:hypothetical protein
LKIFCMKGCVKAQQIVAICLIMFSIDFHAHAQSLEDVVKKALTQQEEITQKLIEAIETDPQSSKTPPPPPPTAQASLPSFQISEMDEKMVALKNANVRSHPSTNGNKIGKINSGTNVDVTGTTSIGGATWYRIKLNEGTTGYVFGGLLKTLPQEIKNSDNQEISNSGSRKDHNDLGAIALLVWLGGCLVVSLLAKFRGRRAIFWFLISLVLWIAALIPLFLLKNLKKTKSSSEQPVNIVSIEDDESKTQFKENMDVQKARETLKSCLRKDMEKLSPEFQEEIEYSCCVSHLIEVVVTPGLLLDDDYEQDYENLEDEYVEFLTSIMDEELADLIRTNRCDDEEHNDDNDELIEKLGIASSSSRSTGDVGKSEEKKINPSQNFKSEKPIEKIIDEITEKYSDHDDFDEMLSDLGSNDFLDHWANKFCGEEFGQNKGLARKLYVLQLEKSDTCREIAGVADNVIDEECLGDKIWAKEIYEKAVSLADCSADYADIADTIVLPERLSDKEWARKLYADAIEMAEDVNDYRTIAESLADDGKLGNKTWAKEVYQKAIDIAVSCSDLQSVASSLVQEYYLSDKEWAAKVMKQAIAADDLESHYDATSIARDLVYNFEDKVWAKTVYQKAIDLCDDNDQRKDVISEIKTDLEDLEWADELVSNFDISMSSNAVITTPECTVHYEVMKIEELNSLDKFKAKLEAFEESADSESISYSIADSIESFETEDGDFIDYEVNDRGSLIPSVDDDEIALVFYYSYNNSSYSVSLNDPEEPVYIQTQKFGQFELIRSFEQNGDELEYEMETADDSDGNYLGFMSNNSGHLQVINLKELYEECDEDEDALKVQKCDLIYQMLQGELNKSNVTITIEDEKSQVHMKGSTMDSKKLCETIKGIIKNDKDLPKEIREIYRESEEGDQFYCCLIFLQDFITENIEDDNFEIDWDEAEGAKSVADAMRPLLDSELRELLENDPGCVDDEHHHWINLLKDNVLYD